MQYCTVALLQISSHANNLEQNQLKGEQFCRRASVLGADIALFPEMWSAGYLPTAQWDRRYNHWMEPQFWQNRTIPEDLPTLEQVWEDAAVDRDGPYVKHFQALARELNMAIAITYLERWTGGPRNTVSLIDRHGEIVLTYAKVHTCDWDLSEFSLTPGDDFPVCELDTAQGKVKVGAMICYDREFPETARILMLNGAELILVPNACDLERQRIQQFETRAYENMLGVAMTNYPGRQMGHSCAFDGVAFDQLGTRNTLLVEAGEREGIFPATFNLDQIRHYRKEEIWGNSFRRPHRYAKLVDPDIQTSFVRVNKAGEPYDPSKR